MIRPKIVRMRREHAIPLDTDDWLIKRPQAATTREAMP